MVICEKCNCSIGFGHKYCRNCGMKLSDTIIEKINLEHLKMKNENEVEQISTEENFLSSIKVLEEENTIIDVEQDEVLDNIKKKRINIRQIIGKEENKVMLLMFIMVFIFIFSGVIKKTFFEVKESYGINGNSFITSEGENVYFTNVSEVFPTSSSSVPQISTYKITGKKAEEIFKGFAEALNVKNNYLYYIESADDFGIFKIRTDGTNKQKLFKGRAIYLKVNEDFMYFITYNDTGFSGELFRMKLNGTEQTKISSDVLTCEIVGNSIYYSSYNELGTVYKMKLDGSAITKLCTIDGVIQYIKDGYIYYKGKEGNTFSFGLKTTTGTREYENQQKLEFLYSNGYLYRVKIDGSGKQELLNKSNIEEFFYNNNIIYRDPSKGIFMIDLDGKNEVQLLDNSFNISPIYISNNSLYYYNEQENKLYRKVLNSMDTTIIEIVKKRISYKENLTPEALLAAGVDYI